MLTIQQVIDAADNLVTNVIPVDEKVKQLNNIDRDFYANVKVPTTYYFGFEKNIGLYELAGAKMKSKDIEIVQIGPYNYKQDKNTSSFRTSNLFNYNDENKELNLIPPPPFRGEGRIMYYMNSFADYSTSDMDHVLEIPEEFHQTFIPALASWIALVEDDITKATVYETQYRSAWNAASQNYGGS